VTGRADRQVLGQAFNETQDGGFPPTEVGIR